MTAGCGFTLLFATSTSLFECAVVFFIVGLGMGFVSIPTLLIVQGSLDASDLGVATASHQFTRTLGGTVGIGIAGSFVTARLSTQLEALSKSKLVGKVSESLQSQIPNNIENMFQPELITMFSAEIQRTLQDVVVQGVRLVFWAATTVSVITLVLCWMLPKQK